MNLIIDMMLANPLIKKFKIDPLVDSNNNIKNAIRERRYHNETNYGSGGFDRISQSNFGLNLKKFKKYDRYDIVDY